MCHCREITKRKKEQKKGRDKIEKQNRTKSNTDFLSFLRRKE